MNFWWQTSKCVLYWNLVKKFMENCFGKLSKIIWAFERLFFNVRKSFCEDNLQFAILSHLIKFKCDYKIFQRTSDLLLNFPTSIFYVAFLVSLIIFWWKWMMLMENFQLKLLLSVFGYMTFICCSHTSS